MRFVLGAALLILLIVVWLRAPDVWRIWGTTGIIFLAGVVYCFRTMGRGRTNLTQAKARYQEIFSAGERKLEDEKKDIGLDEQLRVLRAGVEDLLRLEEKSGYSFNVEGNALSIQTPAGPWTIELLMREQTLRSTRRVLHGHARWLLHGFGKKEEFGDMASLMAGLTAHLHGDSPPQPEPEHFARRIRSGNGRAARGTLR